MLPTLCPGDTVLVSPLLLKFLPPKIGELIVVEHPVKKTPLVKRIKDMKKDTLYVCGDNISQSTDSRHFGWIERKKILGKVLYTFS